MDPTGLTPETIKVTSSGDGDAPNASGNGGVYDGEGISGDAAVECELITGQAGTGKTYSIRERIESDPAWGLLAATTGIAAINLNTITLNSCLRYFDTLSLRDCYLSGLLMRRLRDIREDYRRLVIDEVSMMDGEQLSIIVRAALEANSWLSQTNAPPLGICVVGDFCQLPPVKAKWAFESDEWQRFAQNVTRLTKVWRQEDIRFLAAINAARSGDGATASTLLTEQGLQWETALDIGFDGTTIVSKNDQVDRYNAMALDRLMTPPFTLTSRRWGKQRGEWKQVPERVTLKSGAYVMLLANRYDEGRMVYANGDCGHVREWDGYALHVELLRTGQVVEVDRVVRDVGPKDKPEGWKAGGGTIGRGEWLPRPHWLVDKRRFVEGQVEYYPVRLAYASTVHKSQGLSLDRAQIDIRDQFFKQPGMLYVALSRCKTLEGLRIVGQPERFVKHCNIDERVRSWL